ncbi:MAG: 3-dehydroquinate synthase [Candidatus Hydrogenedentota bacterium]
MKKIAVNLGERSYKIFIGSNILNRLTRIINHLDNEILHNECKGLGKNAVLISDSYVNTLWGDKLRKSLCKCFNINTYLLKRGERHKSFENYKKILDFIFNINKQIDTILAFGGGVIGDITGFVASSYKRGINLLYFPTTLLACVDCSVGGKTGVNYEKYKNMVGTFYQPRLVFIDTQFLKTLSMDEYRNGLAEVIKYALCFDKSFFKYLDINFNKILNKDLTAVEYIIKRCCVFKADIVSRDEFDKKNLRVSLNLGHSFAHVFESLTDFKGISHGEAVAIGIIAASNLSKSLGYINDDCFNRIYQLIKKMGLPVKLKLKLNKILFKNIILKDKKNIDGKLRLVLLEDIGRYRVVENLAIKDVLAACDVL